MSSTNNVYVTVLVFVCIVKFVDGLILDQDGLPLVLTTWPYQDAVRQGWHTIVDNSKSAVDAVEATGNSCEMSQCLFSVGFGGTPDENGETTLDAMIMDGLSHDVGAVGGLRRIKQAISVARKVMDNTEHTLLVGDQAVRFAVQMGFKEENLTTEYSKHIWETWKRNNCQPNFRVNVSPNSNHSCGPYQPLQNAVRFNNGIDEGQHTIGIDNHDTIGIIVIDRRGNIAAGGSTNGLTYKVPGRVGDTPIVGAGSYVDNDIGAATCTGNGDIMMRFLPSYQAVSLMATGSSPEMASKAAIHSIVQKYPNFRGAIVAANKRGFYGAACHSMTDFAFTVKTPTFQDATVFNVTCSGIH